MEQLEAEIAPLLLPGELREFWRAVDPWSVRLQWFLSWCDLDFVLFQWRSDRDEFFRANPLPLRTFAYGSHLCLSTELSEEPRETAPLYWWNLVDGDFLRLHESFSEHLHALCDAIDEGRSQVSGGYVLLELPEYLADQRARKSNLKTISRDPRLWPDRWLRPLGLTQADAQLREATHHVADLPPPDADLAPVTLRGRVQQGCRDERRGPLTVRDDTGSVTVPRRDYCTTFVRSLAEPYEVELEAADGEWKAVVVRPLEPPIPTNNDLTRIIWE